VPSCWHLGRLYLIFSKQSLAFLSLASPRLSPKKFESSHHSLQSHSVHRYSEIKIVSLSNLRNTDFRVFVRKAFSILFPIFAILHLLSLPKSIFIESKFNEGNLIEFVYCVTSVKPTFTPHTVQISFPRDATLSSLFYFIQDYSTCFGYSLRPSSGVLKTLCATTGTSHRLG
jgi:hypothetical protein